MEEQIAQKKEKRDYILPVSILIAALLVSFALVYSAGKNSSDQNKGPLTAALEDAAFIPKPTVTPLPILPIDPTKDHILGNPNAPVKIIEYSDLECPFCKIFHVTLQQVIELYGDKVAWVYRHFPLDELHSKARKEAEASECAAELGGNDGFWKYVNRLYEITPSNDGLDPKKLPEIAGAVGLSIPKFNACLESGKFKDRVEAHVKDATVAGGRGTPHSIVLSPSGNTYMISGALPLNDPGNGRPWVRLFIDTALREKKI